MSAYVLNANKSRAKGAGRKISNSGFQSLDDIYKKALDELSMAQTSEEIANLLKNYNDVIMLSDSTFVPKIDNEFYRTICNRERIYESEGFVHKIIDNQFLVLAEKENLNRLRKIEFKDNLDTSIFKLVQYNNNSESKDETKSSRTSSWTCTNNIETWYYYDPSGCKNDRKIYAAAGTWWLISGNNFTPWLASRIWGRRRAGTLCYWYGYSTVLSYRNIQFDVKIVINGITHHFVLDEGIPDYYGTAEESEKQIWNNSLTGSITWQGGTPPAISFTRAVVEGSSRGTNNNWVTIDCIE